MKYKIFAFLLCVFVVPCWAMEEFDDEFDGVIQDSEEQDFDLESVELNPDSDTVNVSGFDIAGAFLGMQYEDIHDLFFHGNSLYIPRKKESIIYTIHPDWKVNLDYECRQQNIFIPSELDSCIKKLAFSRGLVYVSEIHVERPSTGETIDISLTSNATDNRVWGIVYNNDANIIEGVSEQFEKQKDKKLLSWWQGVLEKYGEPNSGTDKWISSTNAYDPTMTAYYGSLELKDAGLQVSDNAKNIQQARENFKAKPYSF